jgi:hypothetical protein
MEAACESRYAQLVADGCDEGVAQDRTWDAMRHATGEMPGECFDPRDSDFQRELERIREGMNQHYETRYMGRCGR